jgi:hypothetical protein
MSEFGTSFFVWVVVEFVLGPTCFFVVDQGIGQVSSHRTMDTENVSEILSRKTLSRINFFSYLP